MTVRDQTKVVGAVQMAPVFLDREATLAKVEGYVDQAGANGCELVAFGETVVPGYPFWLGRTDGAKFNSDLQRDIHSLYTREAVRRSRPATSTVCATLLDGTASRSCSVSPNDRETVGDTASTARRSPSTRSAKSLPCIES